jgi:hypothetical protein
MQLQGFRQLLAFSGAATTTAASIQAVGQLCNALVLQNDPGSTNNLIVGGAGGQSIVLEPGGDIEIKAVNTSIVWVKSAAGTANWNALAGVY